VLTRYSQSLTCHVAHLLIPYPCLARDEQVKAMRGLLPLNIALQDVVCHVDHIGSGTVTLNFNHPLAEFESCILLWLKRDVDCYIIKEEIATRIARHVNDSYAEVRIVEVGRTPWAAPGIGCAAKSVRGFRGA